MTSTLDRSSRATDPFGFEQPFSEEPPRPAALAPVVLETWESPYAENQVAATSGVTSGTCLTQIVEPRYALVHSHVGTSPDLVLRWSNVVTDGPVDVVVHFHGYSDARDRMRIDTEKLPDSGLDFCDPKTGAAGRQTPTLAILPRGNYSVGKWKNAYDFPNLIVKGAVGRLIDDGLARLALQTGLSLTRGRVILTGHSGGGAPVTRVVEAVDPDEVHIFDGMYGSGNAIVRWATKRVAREMAAPAAIPPALRVLYRAGDLKNPGTQLYSEDLARQICDVLATAGARRLAPRFSVDRTAVRHSDIPRRYGWALLADASATLPGTVSLRCAAPKGKSTEMEMELESLEGEQAMEGTAWASTETLEQGLAWEQPASATEFPAAEGESRSEAEDGRATSEQELMGSDESWPTEAGESSPWTGTPDQVAFREAVLAAHLERSRKAKGAPGRDLRRDELGPVAGTDVEMRADAAEAAGRLLAAATRALADTRQAGNRDALRTTSLTASSGYRGRDHQARLWRRYFPGYYRATAEQREALVGGRHAPAAQRYMIDVFRIPNWIAAPGYSNHQAGIAIDLVQLRSKGSEIANSGNSQQLARWRASWFHGWLIDNASRFGFQPYKREPWHWEFRDPDTSRFAELPGESRFASEGSVFEQLDLASDSEASYEAWLEDEETGEEFGEPEALDEVEQPASGLFAGEPATERQAIDENYFENDSLSAAFAPREEGQVADIGAANDPPTRVARPPWPGRRLRLTKRPYLRGSDVLAWQRQMIERNWRTALGMPFKDDGIFGPQTAIVTSRFQQVQNLPITGVVDAITWAAAWITGAGATPPVIAYDRGAAFDYARKHWNVVTSDGFVAGTFGAAAFKAVPAATKFVHDPDDTEHAVLPGGSTIPWTDLDDCTHFISCCIGQPPGGGAGGLPVVGQLGSPPSAPYGMVRVSSLVAFLTKQKWVALEGERSTDIKLITRLQRGDLVAYFNEKRGRYTHLAFYLGNGKIACHTYCRFDKTIDAACTWDDDWDLGAGSSTYTWTFLRFVV